MGSEETRKALAAYARHFQRAPNVVLVNPDEVTTHPGVTVRGESYIRKNNYWVGYEAPSRPPRAAGSVDAIH